MSVQRLKDKNLLANNISLTQREQELIDAMNLTDDEIDALASIAKKLGDNNLNLKAVTNRTALMRL